MVLDGETVNDPKIQDSLDMLRIDYDVPPLEIQSDNNFPTAAGLASSASGFAALVTAINAHCELGMTDQQRSEYARRASGSAARSIFGGFVGLNEPDWTATQILAAETWPLKVVIAITDEKRKEVSSSAGMRLSEETSPFYEAWVTTTAEDYTEGLMAIRDRNFPDLVDLAETSCLKMHGVMQSSRPPMIYWRDATIGCIHAIRELRRAGSDVFFTIDAGPQVKAVCTEDSVAAVAETLAGIPGVLATHVVGLGNGAELVAE